MVDLFVDMHNREILARQKKLLNEQSLIISKKLINIEL